MSHDPSGLLRLSSAAAGATCWVFCSDSTITSSTNEKAASSAKKKKAKAKAKVASDSGTGRSQNDGDSGDSSSTTSALAKGLAPPSMAPNPEPSMNFEHGAENGQCVGTLRWSSGSSFPRLGAWPAELVGKAPTLGGWRDYLEWRLTPDATGTIKVEAPLLDGLSYPLSLVFALQLLRLKPPQPGPLFVLIVGASSKAEERLVRDSDYWQEISRFFVGASIELVFVGPEMARASHGKVTRLSSQLTARNFHGTLGDLLKAEPNRHTAESSIVVGFNTGFGNCSDGMHKGGFPLMMGWLADLIELLRLGLVAIFTSANDYSDLRGELTLFQNLHASLVLPPRRNPFKAATVVRESDAAKCEWSCSSCYLYAVCGRDEGSPALPAPGADLSELKRSIKKVAKKLAQTQTVSAVP